MVVVAQTELSEVQKGIFVDCQIDSPDSYNISATILLNNLNEKHFENAFSLLVKEQAVLRSTIEINENDMPMLVVHDQVKYEWERVELTNSGGEWKVALDDLIKEQISKAFTLNEGPLFRVKLVKLTSDQHAFIMCFHHLISDGISMEIVKEKLLSYYGKLLNKKTMTLEQDQGFLSFMEEENAMLEAGKYKEHKQFWQEKMRNAEPLEIPYDYAAQTTQGAGAEASFQLPEELMLKVQEVSMENEITDFMFFLSVFGLLMHKYTQEEDILFSSPFAHRQDLDIEHTIGNFVSMLPVRLSIKEDGRPKDVFQHVFKSLIDIHKNAKYPNNLIMRDNNLVPIPGSPSVFDISFVYDVYDESSEDNVFTGIYDPKNVSFPGNLMVILNRTGSGDWIKIQYKKDVFKAETIHLMGKRFIKLLSDIINNPATSTKDLTIRLPEEEKKILGHFNQTSYLPYDPETIIDIFHQKVKLYPQLLATLEEDCQDTYETINEKANQLSHVILKNKRDENEAIGIQLERSTNLIVSVLAVLKAGCCYVPIDIGYPLQRKEYIVEDATISQIITTANHLHDTPPVDTIIDINDPDIYQHPVENPIIERDAYDLAYIIYTSGSTGNPKGVMIENHSVVNALKDLDHRFPMKENDRYLFKTPFTFDVSVTELFGWFIGEGTLVILPPDDEKDPEAVLDEIASNQITHINFVPSMFRLFLDRLDNRNALAKLASLKWIFVGGEAITSDLLNKFYRLETNIPLENVYGPTETTIWVSHQSLSQEDTEENISIGRPLNENRWYIVNPNNQLQPIGIAGELCISGAGLARGYLNRDDLTEESFILNPFYDKGTDGDHYKYMYKTGDLARWLSDGTIEFIGRKDFQVKIRGIRLETEEIEKYLANYKSIVQAVVVPKEDANQQTILCAYYLSEAPIPENKLIEYLGESLPAYMIPSFFIYKNELPHNSSGKIDRNTLIADTEHLTSKVLSESAPPVTKLEKKIASVFEEVLSVKGIGLNDDFFQMGGTSLSLIQLHYKLEKKLQQDFSIAILMRAPTVRQLADYFEEKPEDLIEDRKALFSSSKSIKRQDIAIIGMSANVPGAENVEEFWRNLVDGKESIHFYTDEELERHGIDMKTIHDPNYVKAKGRINGVDHFDANFFGYTPAEVNLMSPQLRLLLKGAWEALEDAGYYPGSDDSKIGVYVGGSDDFEWYRHALFGDGNYSDKYQAFTMGSTHFLATRIAHNFNIKGPAYSALTGCSTTLVTPHLASQSLILGETDIALAGGITVEMPNEGGYYYERGLMFSPDGHCRPFDAAAEGTMFSNGMGFVVLKRLDEAIRDGDNISAVIKGSAINNDGNQKVGFTAPSVDGQREVIQEAYKLAGIDPETVSYVEAHGTGTAIGDPIEIQSLTEAFSSRHKQFCTLGSVKGNIGHTDTAAGVVGLIKTALSLEHKYLPGTVNYKSPNPKISLEQTPFIIKSKGESWEQEGILRAGINSFGIGGSNAHMILEEYKDESSDTNTDDDSHLLVFSAKTETALKNSASNVLTYIAQEESNINIADAAWTLQVGRKRFPYRTSIVWHKNSSFDVEEMITTLDSEVFHDDGDTEKRIYFMFPGQGSQYQGMAKGLYTSTNNGLPRLFKHHLDTVFDCLNDTDKVHFKDVIFGHTDPEVINETENSQFAIFSTSYALANAMIDIGIEPQGMIGHSIGELVAATISGVFSLPDAINIVLERGKIMQKQKPGVMLAVMEKATVVEPKLIPNVWLSLNNSSSSCVVGGTDEGIRSFEKILKSEGIKSMRLKTSHAFHTPMMEDAASEFLEYLKSYKMNEPTIPILANGSGTWSEQGYLSNPEYWSNHLLQPVRFAESLDELLTDEDAIYIEVGAGRSLISMVRQHQPVRDRQVLMNLLPHPREKTAGDVEYIYKVIGKLWGAGVSIDWHAYKGSARRKRISLPTYAFDKMNFPVTLSHSQNEVLSQADQVSDIVSSKEKPKMNVIKDDNELKRAIIESYQTVFGFEDIKEEQDFFDLGGDSLKAVSLSSAILAKTDIDVDISSLFEHTTPAKLALFLADHVDDKHIVPTIKQIPERPFYDLSSAQERMYALYLLDKDNLAYNLPSVTIIEGELDYQKMKQGLEKLINRHESLRTSFEMRDNRPVQIVHDHVDVPLVYVVEKISDDKSTDQFVERFVKPFRLEDAPLFRATLVKSSDKKHILFLDFHHIIADGTSVEIITRDFNDIYFGSLLEPTIQYKDFAAWQNDMLQSPAMEASRDYWLQVLDNDIPVLSLPTDFERPLVKDFEGSRVYFTLDKHLTEKLHALSKKTSTTLFMILLSVWKILLSRYANQEDIIVGTPVAGRTTEEVKDTVGMFINMLAMRGYPSGDKSFEEYLQEVKRNALAAFEHQDYQFDELVDQLDLPRELNRNALFDVCFDFQNMEFHEPEMDGISFTPHQVDVTGTAYDLVLTCEEDKENRVIYGFLEYATGLFKEETIHRMVKQFEYILETIVEQERIKIANLDIVPHDEKKLLAELNETSLAYDSSLRLEEMFLRKVQKHPDKTALILENGDQLTYRELNDRSNALAWHLIDQGVKPGSLVGIMTERNENLFIALFGILKSGGAYVPIDPAFPSDRIHYMLDKSNTNILICESKMDLAFEGHIIDNEKLTSLGKREDSPDILDDIDSLASVTFTSGSTGNPKGVMINHRSIVNFIHDVIDREIYTKPTDRIMSVTTLSFDIFGFESFATLCTGHSIYLANETEQLDASLVAEKIVEYECTHILSTVSRIKAFIENPYFDKALKQLTCILSGGEHYPKQLLHELQSRSNAKLYNMYGPTETTIWSTAKELTHAKSVNIGNPIANTQTYIVNQTGNLQPLGVYGELCIAGDGLAEGYLNNPEETNEKFLKLPFNPNKKVYRTGDRARLLPNGEIELKGRLDSQVKIRGYRVEINEIEQVLLSHEHIREAVVLTEGEGNEKRLILYFCVKEDADKEHMTYAYLRKWMETKLPIYAIPSQSLLMEDMPVLPNGKINRNALPASNEYVVDVTSTENDDYSGLEQTILDMWKNELDTDSIRINDNFFDVGGNSLGMIRINNALSTYLDESLPLMKMFEHPTIASMAAYINENYDSIEVTKKSRKGKISSQPESKDDIAVIGMAGQFPGAPNIYQYWENIKNGTESITSFTDEELQASGIKEEELSHPNYVKSKGYLENVEHFDHEFFDYPYQESNNMDPQMRLLHQNVWEVLEMAGYRPSDYDGAIGLFAGSGSNALWISKFMNNEQDILSAFEALTLNEKDFLTSRISYKLNLRGPSYNVQTACSTSLVAIHQAVQSLQNNESDMAIAGGVTITYPQKEGYLWHEGMIFSKDGHCRAFSDDATGTVSGNGSGVVLLKPLSAAERDGDTIYAVVKGTATNNDGYEKVGYTAPSIEGQTKVIKKAMQDANLEAESIDYVEAHGTGTRLGDPIEVEALKQAWNTSKTNYCAIGSVKANVGHLDAAAGVAGFIKTVLMLYHREIPPHINYNQPNRQIDFQNSPFYVNKQLKDFPKSNDIMRASVSSFGIGGTNAHIVLEEHKEPGFQEEKKDTNRYLFVFSGKSQTALDNTSKEVLDYLKANKEISLQDAAWTLQVGREPFEYRKSVVLSRDMLNTLSVGELEFSPIAQVDDSKKARILLFPNETSIYQGICSDLFDIANTHPVARLYRKYIEDVLAYVSVDEKQYISDVFNRNKSSFSVQAVTKNRLAIFANGYALAKTLLDVGIKCDAFMGQNTGEIGAIAVSGLIQLPDALDMIRTLGDWIAYQEGGSITSHLMGDQTNQHDSDRQVVSQLNSYKVSSARIPIIVSNLTEEINREDAMTGSILSITDVMKDKGIFIDLGSGGVLTNIMKQLLGSRAQFLNVLPRAGEEVRDIEHIYNTLGEIWCSGIDLEWDTMYNEKVRKRIPLPTYVFDTIFHDSDVILNHYLNEKQGHIETDTKEVSQDHSTEHAEEYIENHIEEKLEEIWCEILGCESVSEDDDFFELGGHSLKAITLASEMEHQFSVDILLSDIFTHSVFSDLVQYVHQNEPTEFVASKFSPVEKKEYYEVSSAQKRMYVVHDMMEDSLAYNLAASYDVEGAIDFKKFKHVIDQLVKRHEAFRTSFHMIDGEVFQKVHENIPVPLEFETIDEAEINEKIKDFITPFDLKEAPLMRAKLLSYDTEKHVLVIDMHHIISDQSSIAILMDEIKALYAGEDLAQLSIQYKDFAVWQNEYFKTDEYAEKMSYWKNEFKDDAPLLGMLTDFNRPNVELAAGDTITFDFGTDLSERIYELSNRLGLTPFMTLMAALKIVLWKYSDQKDLVVGTGVSGRNYAEVESIIGMFVNTLAIRTEIDETSTYKDFLLYIKEKMLRAYDHQDCQYEMLVDDLDVEVVMGRNPLFEVVINYINMGTEEFTLEGLSLEEREDIVDDAKFDLTWTILENNNNFIAELEYRTSLYKRESMEMFGQSLLNVVSDLTHSDITKQLKDISILTERDHQYYLHDINETQTDAPLDKSIIHLFEEVVEEHGDNEALQWKGDCITYKDLNTYVNNYAMKIQEHGIKTGSPIAILLDRGPEQIISILAVLKTGCVYVPIDPTLPEERIQYILQDSAALGVVTSKTYQSMISDSTDVLLVEEMPKHESIKNVQPKDRHMTGEHTAYIMYTSGSTGKPKGTIIRHKNIIRVVKETNYIDIQPSDRLLQLSNYSFDGSTFDIYGALLNGARLVMVPEESIIEISHLTKLIIDAEITVFFITTALFNALVDWDVTCLENVRKVLFGGEETSVQHVRKAFKTLGPNRLMNVYGPTESTVFTTFYPIDHCDDQTTIIPIGYPISNTTLYVVDENGNIVPPNVPGELYIGGAGVAKGYVNKDELTEEKFIHFPNIHGERVYRTGDLVWRKPSGEICFLGREDFQVKIRGFRIDLSEIESRIRDIDGIREVIVITKKDKANDTMILAYFTVDQKYADRLGEAEVKGSLNNQLPEYMIPSRFMKMDNLPLNNNGKIDQKALPMIETLTGKEEDDLNSSHNSIKEIILKQMQKVLDFEGLRVHDDFFEYGGQSLKAISLIQSLAKFDITRKVTDVFQHPTAHMLANLGNSDWSSTDSDEEQKRLDKADLNSLMNQAKVSELLQDIKRQNNMLSETIKSTPVMQTFSLAPVQKVHSVITRRNSGFMTYVPGLLTERDLKLICTKMISQYQLLHSVISDQTGVKRWKEHDISDVSASIQKNIPYVSMASIDHMHSLDVLQRLAFDLFQMEYMEGELPWRILCMQIDQETHVIVWGFDHIAFDGMSADVLKNEIESEAFKILQTKDNKQKLADSINVKAYSDYVDLVTEKPVTISEDEIIDHFSLEKWNEKNKTFMNKLGEVRNDETHEVTVHLPLNEANENIWEDSFQKLTEILSEYTDMKEIPVSLVHYGRHYQDAKFYDCVGEFLDVIPMLMTPKIKTEQIQKYIDMCKKHAINFFALLMDNELKKQYPKIHQLLEENFKGSHPNKEVVLVNFQGYVSKEESSMLDQEIDQGPNSRMAVLYITISYDDTDLKIHFDSFKGLDVQRIQQIAEAIIDQKDDDLALLEDK